MVRTNENRLRHTYSNVHPFPTVCEYLLDVSAAVAQAPTGRRTCHIRPAPLHGVGALDTCELGT